MGSLILRQFLLSLVVLVVTLSSIVTTTRYRCSNVVGAFSATIYHRSSSSPSTTTWTSRQDLHAVTETSGTPSEPVTNTHRRHYYHGRRHHPNRPLFLSSSTSPDGSSSNNSDQSDVGDGDEDGDVVTSTIYEYDYEPSKPDASPITGRGGDDNHFAGLRSSYPPGTPAGLRGEAVRSALSTTERCITWIREERNVAATTTTSFSAEDQCKTCAAGMIRVMGRGTMDFLNNKLSQSFKGTAANGGDAISSSTIKNRFYHACLLDPKGRVVDEIQVAVIRPDLAYLLTSPGYSSVELLKRLEPFVFPMDEITLTHFPASGSPSDDESSLRCFSFCLASTQYRHVQTVMTNQSKLPSSITSQKGMIFPGGKQSVVWQANTADSGNVGSAQVLVLPTVGLPATACVGYTFIFFDGDGTAASKLGRDVWQRLIDEDNLEGPIEVGPLEYEGLRIEAGQPSCGFEFGPILSASDKGDSTDLDDSKSSSAKFINTSPLELHWKNKYIDFEKGCYLGQEGIASVVKNPRGPPRLLYSVVFEDDFNIYDTQSEEDEDDEFDAFENLTKSPQPGQKLYALGSNEELLVGTLTSVAEPGATGEAETVGLALVKRADSILKQMKEMDLEICRDGDNDGMFDMNRSRPASGVMQPPPMDPLDGLEVVVEGTYTIGRLKCIPQRRLRMSSNLFDDTLEIEQIPDWTPGIDMVPEPSAEQVRSNGVDSGLREDDNKDMTLEELEKEMAKAAAEAEAAAAEAKRKEEKMEMLKKRAEEAMARRRKQQKD